MVKYAEIKAANALIEHGTAPQVAVFAGGTSGIGKLTIEALVATGSEVRIYLIGRKSSAERTDGFIREMQTVNAKAQIVWLEGEISLLADTKRLCEAIRSKESRIDLLFLTAGYAPMSGRKETSEGLEIAQSLEYYSRMLFVLLLLEPLKKAPAPRVVSVLAGSLESTRALKVDDIDLKKPGNFGFAAAQGQYGTLNSVFLDKLASENPDVTFVHSWPGWVNTGNANRGVEPGTVSAWLVRFLLGPLIWLLSFKDEEAGQRHLFISTSAAFGGRGTPWKGQAGVNSLDTHENGLFLVKYNCDSTAKANVMPQLRESAQSRVWEHTHSILRPYL